MDEKDFEIIRTLNRTKNITKVRGEYPWKESKVLISRENIYAIRSNNDASKEFSEIPYINHRTDSAFELELMQWLRENNLHEAIDSFHVDSIETCVEMVKRGLGWAIVPEICLNDFHGIKEKLHFAGGGAFMRSTWLLYSKSASRLPQVKAFIETITSNK